MVLVIVQMRLGRKKFKTVVWLCGVMGSCEVTGGEVVCNIGQYIDFDVSRVCL